MAWINKDGSKAPAPDKPVEEKASKPKWYPVAGITTLRGQVDKRWPTRDKRTDGILGDSAHAARISDHNPDSKGAVHALDLDKDLRGSKYDVEWFADQLIAYPRNKKPGSQRFKNIVFQDRVASGTYRDHYWTWRNGDYGHFDHIHVSFTTAGESDKMEFAIPILINGQGGVWDGAVPFFDILMNSMRTGAANTATWRLACRMKELGFFDGPVLPDGKQLFPTKAIKNMQDYMGWQRDPYNQKIHKTIWKELRVSGQEI